MGLYKRNETWCIQYFANGRRVREAIGPSKRQAQLVLSKRQADLGEGRYFETQKEKPLAFSVLADRYLEEYAQHYKKPRSYQRNVASAKTLKEFFGDMLIRDITPEYVDQYVQKRKVQQKANATINADMAILSHMFSWANGRKLTRNHPVKGRGKLKATQKDRYLSQEEIQQLLITCTGDIRDMAVIALGTGMRASEILGVGETRWSLSKPWLSCQTPKTATVVSFPYPLR